MEREGKAKDNSITSLSPSRALPWSHVKHDQWAEWGKVLIARCAWTAQTQWTEVKLRQPLMMSECLPEHVWRAGDESQTAWTAEGVSAVHWLMFKVLKPSSSFPPFTDPHILFFTLLCAKEYIALSVMFLQKYSPRDLRWGHLFAKAITLSSAIKDKISFMIKTKQ
jgi:hypothetical protein